MGVSIGLFVAFLPTIGFQMGLALVIAWMFNASRPAAIASVWVTNPITMGPLYAMAYFIGRPFWYAHPEISFTELSTTIHGSENSFFTVSSVFSAFHNMYSMGSGLYVPMLIGGIAMGLVASFLGYFPTKSITTQYQRIRRRKSRHDRRGHSVVSKRNGQLRFQPVSQDHRRSSRSRRRRAA